METRKNANAKRMCCCSASASGSLLDCPLQEISSCSQCSLAAIFPATWGAVCQNSVCQTGQTFINGECVCDAQDRKNRKFQISHFLINFFQSYFMTLQLPTTKPLFYVTTQLKTSPSTATILAKSLMKLFHLIKAKKSKNTDVIAQNYQFCQSLKIMLAALEKLIPSIISVKIGLKLGDALK